MSGSPSLTTGEQIALDRIGSLEVALAAQLPDDLLGPSARHLDGLKDLIRERAQRRAATLPHPT